MCVDLSVITQYLTKAIIIYKYIVLYIGKTTMDD